MGGVFRDERRKRKNERGRKRGWGNVREGNVERKGLGYRRHVEEKEEIGGKLRKV